MQNANKNGFDSVAPVAENDTGRLVDLCAEQINAAVDEAFSDIDALSCSVLDTARHANELIDVISAQNPDASDVNTSAAKDVQALQQSVQDCYVKLQFADRLHQRLSNVSKNLADLAKLMQSSELPIGNPQWTGLLHDIRANYTMKPERKMFDAVFGALAPVDANSSMDESYKRISLDGDDSNGG